MVSATETLTRLREDIVLAVVWQNWDRGLKTPVREMSRAAGYKGEPGAVLYLVLRLCTEGYISRIAERQPQLGGRVRHFYTRGPRLAGIDKRTGRPMRIIDESRGWL